MLINSTTPGYIDPTKKYAHVPHFDAKPVPKKAKGQEDIVYQGRETKGKVFTDVRPPHRTTILIDA